MKKGVRMRPFPVFEHLPETVPSSLYNRQVAGSFRKLVKMKPKEIVPTKSQIQIVRSIARMLPREIWFDKLLFPMSIQTSLALANMKETFGELVGYTGHGFCVIEHQGNFVLYNKQGVECVRGTIPELYSYAVAMARNALPAIKQATLDAVFPTISRDDVTNLQELLRAFRQQRQFSGALEKTTKILQLDYLDQDSTMVKFEISYDEPQHNNCLHLGSGNMPSTSLMALRAHYQRVVCVDPLLTYEGPDFKRESFDLSKVEPGWDIVCDIAYGDEFGMIEGDSERLVQQLFAISGERFVLVKLPIGPNYEHCRGFFRRKPRPHNLEVIVQLTPYGDSLCKILSDCREGVIEANNIRNEWMYRQSMPDKYQDVYFNAFQIKEFLRQDGPTFNKSSIIDFPRINRNEILVQQGPYNRALPRMREFAKICRDPGFDFDGSYGKLPCGYVQPGVAFFSLDPGFNDPSFSLRSLYYNAIERGLKVSYDVGSWIAY